MGTIFIARDVANRLPDSEFKLTPATMNSMGAPFPLLTIPGYVVTLPDGRSARVKLGKLGFKKLNLGMVKDIGPRPKLVTLYAPELEISFLVTDKADSILFQEFPAVGEALENVFKHFVHQTGKEARVEISTLGIVAPEKRTDGKFRILVGALPPGPLTESKVKSLPEHKRSLQRSCLICDRPALGAGTVVYDPNGVAVAQIFEDNLYLFLRIDRNDMLLFREGFIYLLTEMLAFSWEAYLKQEPVERTLLTDPETLADASAAWVDSLRVISENALRDAEEKVKETEKAYTEALNAWKTMQIAWRTVPAFKEEFHARRDATLASWKKVLEHPLTDTIEEFDEGFHLATRELVVEHDGKAYRLGTFGIRLDLLGEFEVWNMHPTHPDGEPHPHISKCGTVCYGNITLALRERITVRRDYAGAMFMVLDWLAYGYEPASSIHKIEEWPLKENT